VINVSKHQAPVQYVLSGLGIWDADWLTRCLKLFQQQGVAIRRLVLLHPHVFQLDDSTKGQTISYLEIHFAIPVPESDFLDHFNQILSKVNWHRQELVPTTAK
jgi:hypothetical protein